MGSVQRRRATSDDAAPGAAYVAAVPVTGKDGAVLAAVGETCDRVPASALTWLAECGAIVPAPRDDGGEA